MDKKRKVYAPFSLTSEAGVAQTPVEGYIDVIQTVFPSVNTGTINENGTWTGVKSSDSEFRIGGTDAAIANGGNVLVPGGNTPFINMTGFNHLNLAIFVTNGGNMAVTAVMGPDTESYANLSPINAAADLKGNQSQTAPFDFEDIFTDSSQAMTANVWNIFMIRNVLADQKLLQFKLTNNTGGANDITFAYMRLV